MYLSWVLVFEKSRITQDQTSTSTFDVNWSLVNYSETVLFERMLQHQIKRGITSLSKSWYDSCLAYWFTLL